MFRNSYVRHEFGLVNAWQPQFPHIDQNGDVILIDERLNLLLVVMAPARPNDLPPEDFGRFVW